MSLYVSHQLFSVTRTLKERYKRKELLLSLAPVSVQGI
jgi:hypothetical protein